MPTRYGSHTKTKGNERKGKRKNGSRGVTVALLAMLIRIAFFYIMYKTTYYILF